MVDEKNEQIKAKEKMLVDLRETMKRQAEKDANEINRLRSQLTANGSSALGKLQNLVQRYDTGDKVQTQSNTSLKQAQLANQQLEEALRAKDNEIRNLRAGKQGEEERGKRTAKQSKELKD